MTLTSGTPSSRTSSFLSTPASSAANGPASPPHSKKFWNNALYADITVHLSDEETLHAHRFVLSRVPALHLLCMKEEHDDPDRCIDLLKDDPTATKVMLATIYDYTFEEAMDLVKNADSLMGHINVFKLALKYEIPSLAIEVAKSFDTLLPRRFQADPFDVRCYDVINSVYELDPDYSKNLRATVMKLDTKLDDQRLRADPKLTRERLLAVPEFAADILVMKLYGWVEFRDDKF